MCAYAKSTNIDPYLHLDSVPPLEHNIIAGAFTVRVRTSEYGRGNQIKVGDVSGTLVAVSKTI